MKSSYRDIPCDSVMVVSLLFFLIGLLNFFAIEYDDMYIMHFTWMLLTVVSLLILLMRYHFLSKQKIS